MNSEEPQSAPSEPSHSAMDTSAPSVDQQATAEAPSLPAGEINHLQQQTPMSKNALKRIRKQKEWEEGLEDRRQKRRDKRKAHKTKVRSERAALVAGGADPDEVYGRNKKQAVVVPVAIVIDCDFEQYMTDKERISLSSQVTRAYSDNRNARYRSHLWIAGFSGRLQERFDTKLQGQQKSWKGASVFAGDFVACAAEARAQMASRETLPAPEEDGKDAELNQTTQQQMIGPLQRSVDCPVAWTRDERDPFPLPDPEPPLDPALRDVVYLSSDSPYTLERLEPNTTYVVGGLVDKNREKGLCYRRARERGIRTARLPIGQYMMMQSRQVLATNHVVDIMLKWLEYEDWAKAFLSVIPKRKGGKLRGENGEEAEGEGEGEEAEEQAEGAAEGAAEENVEEDDVEAPKDEATSGAA